MERTLKLEGRPGGKVGQRLSGVPKSFRASEVKADDRVNIVYYNSGVEFGIRLFLINLSLFLL